jgi:hypothetical protein
MAFSGLGAGSAGDPYQITTAGQWNEMFDANYNASHYFKVMNAIDLDDTGSALHLFSNLDGDNQTITVEFNLPAGSGGFITLRNNGLTIKNLKVNVTEVGVLSPQIISQDFGAKTNIVLDNLDFHVLSTSGHPISKFVSGDVPATWTVSNIKFEGYISQVFDNVYCSLSNIHIRLTKPLITSSGFMMNCYYGTLIEKCSVSFGKILIYDAAIFINTVLSGSAFVLDQCRVDGCLEGSGASAFIKAINNVTTISNCYFNGDLVDYTNSFTTQGIQAFQRSGGGSGDVYTNNYAAIKTLAKKIWTIRNEPEYFPNEFGFDDWFIPSKDELALLITYLGIQNWKFRTNTAGLWAKIITSSESSATQFHAYNPVGGWSTQNKTGDYYALVLFRYFNYNSSDIPVVGKKIYDGICVWKDDQAGQGLMAQETPVALGACLFEFGGSGTTLGTGTAVGTGQGNTALMKAAITSTLSAVNWETYAYPTISAYNTYPTMGYTSGTYNKNYYSVVTSDSHQNLQNYPGGIEHLTTTDIRDTSKLVNWDFTNIWEQSAAGRLATLKNNPETLFVGIMSLTRTGVKNMQIELCLNTDLDGVQSSDVGLILKDSSDNSILYDEHGLSHTVVFSTEKDFTLLVQPFFDDGNTETEIYTDYKSFWSVVQKTVRYISPIVNKILNIATVGFDAKNVHGSLIYNGFIYGSCRTDGRIVKIDCAAPAAITSCLPKDPSNNTLSIDQIVYCNGYIWGQSTGGVLVRIDPSDLSWDSVLLAGLNSSTWGTEPICCSHDRYLYVGSLQYIDKLDTSLLVGATILTDCPGGVIEGSIVGTYDSYEQGQYIDWTGLHPELYTGTAKGRIHSMIVDGGNLYASYSTKETVAGLNIDASGYSAVIQNSVHELHKVKISDMSANGFIQIPKATDDMTQNVDYVFLGSEVQPGADPLTYGYGVTNYAVRKSDMNITLMAKESSNDNLPTYQSYGSLVFGNYLVDIRTDLRFFIIDITNVDDWLMSDPAGKYVLENIMFSPAALSGTMNDLIRGAGTLFHGFTWGVVGGNPQPSGYLTFKMPSAYNMTAVPVVQTLNAVVL